uniref:Uncharacterized protein n=1 Tax=Rhizophora mucronata TaxID=61149 RepID=A0A2P2QYH9_RHIMU
MRCILNNFFFFFFLFSN